MHNWLNRNNLKKVLTKFKKIHETWVKEHEQKLT